MSYSIDDPFVYYSGDFAVLRAAFVELVVRKALQESGFDHSLFMTEFSIGDANGYDVLPDALSFLSDVLLFMGYSVRIPDEDEIRTQIDMGKDFQVEINLPELHGFKRKRVKKYRNVWEEILEKDHFYGMPSKTEIITTKDKKSILKLTFTEEFQYEWAGIADLVFNFCEFRKQVKEVVFKNDDIAHRSELGNNYPMSA